MEQKQASLSLLFFLLFHRPSEYVSRNQQHCISRGPNNRVLCLLGSFFRSDNLRPCSSYASGVCGDLCLLGPESDLPNGLVHGRCTAGVGTEGSVFLLDRVAILCCRPAVGSSRIASHRTASRPEAGPAKKTRAAMRRVGKWLASGRVTEGLQRAGTAIGGGADTRHPALELAVLVSCGMSDIEVILVQHVSEMGMQLFGGVMVVHVPSTCPVLNTEKVQSGTVR